MRPNPRAQARVDEWNATCPVGTKVTRFALMHPRGGAAQHTQTASEAWLMGGHTAVVKVDGHAGGVALDALEVVPPPVERSAGVSTRACLTEAEWRVALEESVKLQAHYAKILNQYDGGARRAFGSADEWIARLRETGTLPLGGQSQIANRKLTTEGAHG